MPGAPDLDPLTHKEPTTMAKNGPTIDAGSAGAQMPPDAAAAADDAPDQPGGNGVADDDEFAIEDNPAQPGPEPEDDFDNPENYALGQDFNPGVREIDAPLACRKPRAFEFFRVNPDPAMTCTVAIVELPDERDDPYIVLKSAMPIFGALASKRQIFVCQNQDNERFLWAAKQPRDDGRKGGGDKYNRTALKGAQAAKTSWIRLESDQSLRCYRIFEAEQPYDEPDWSDCPPLNSMLREAFGDGHTIRDKDHEVTRRIRGAQRK